MIPARWIEKVCYQLFIFTEYLSEWTHLVSKRSKFSELASSLVQWCFYIINVQNKVLGCLTSDFQLFSAVLD